MIRTTPGSIWLSRSPMFRPDASPASEPRSKRVTRAPRLASAYAIVVPAIPPPTTPISLTAIPFRECTATTAPWMALPPSCPHLGEKRPVDPNMLLESRPGEAIRHYPRLEESRFARVPHHLRGRRPG